MSLVTTSNYDVANAQNSKEPVIVLEIEGVPYYFGSSTIYTTIRYDDPDVYYDGVYVYDGLRPLSADTQKPYIDRKGSFSTISQKLEQWDGRASVETCNIKLVDYNKNITLVCSPGFVIEEILNRKVRVFFGYRTLSFPDDYLILFKGYVNSVKMAQGSVYFTFTDPSSKRKTSLFNGSTSTLTTALDTVATSVVMSSTSNLYQTILNAKGVADSTVTIGIVIDDEIMTYTNAGIVNGTTLTVVRGAFGTTAASHDATTEIKSFIYFNDNPINIALKCMLSGWNGPWTSGVGLRGVINTDDAGTIANSFTFEQGVDVVRDYGLTIGDFVTTTGSTIPTNNNTWTIANFANNNRTIIVAETGILTQENPPPSGDISTVCAFRSKYDVYPTQAGLSLTTDDVLVSAHEYIRQTFIQFNFKMPIIGQEKSGKTWIEENLMKSFGGYTLSQGARISMGVTHPPLTTDLTKFITPENVVNAKDIVVERGLNSRFFYNEVYFQYDYDVVKDDFRRSVRYVDADAQKRMRQVSVLQIDVKGLDASSGSELILRQRAQRLLQRYRFAAETIELRTFFSTGHTIDAGDVVVLNDTTPPTLQISNTETGDRGVYNRVMEVQERSIDLTSGIATLKLLSNNGFSFSDRYVVLGPSSQVDGTFANTTTALRIVDSFGAIFPGAEYKKWEDFIGSTIRVHNTTYTQDAETTFTLDLSDPYIMNLNPPLPFTPNGTFYVEFSKYNTTDATINASVKNQFAAFDSTATIFSGSTNTVFVLDSGYSSRYQTGMIVYVMSPNGTSRFSGDVKITSILGDVVTIGPVFTGGANATLGFIPQNGDLMQLAGFKDGGAGYRYI